MLRDSKLRFDRLSPMARVVTVGGVLLCGLLIAGLRGPGIFAGAMASDAEKSTAANAGSEKEMRALVEDFFHHNYRDVTSRKTIEWGKPEKTKDGNFSIRYKYRYSAWWGEPRIANKIFVFTPDGAFVSVDDAEKHPPAPEKVYEVHKKVSDFPKGEDLTTPEAAYASIHWAWAAEGDAAWPRLSVPAMAAHMPRGAKRPLPKEAAKRLLDTEILEVHVWEGIHAVVIAREEASDVQGFYMDMRWLTRVDGRWLNEGNDRRRTIEEARQKIEQSRSS
jgi:hypothetical protein